MKFTEEQVKQIVALKESMVKQIDIHQEGIETLEKNITVLDLFLKDSSFTKASQLETRSAETEPEIPAKPAERPAERPVERPAERPADKPVEKPADNSIPIKRTGDGKVIANAFVTPDQLSIVLANGIAINADTPPFESFFLGRIIGEMKKKDAAEVESGAIQKESVIDCIINKNGEDIKEIIIKNYRQKQRVNELINTAGWSLTRMLENINK